MAVQLRTGMTAAAQRPSTAQRIPIAYIYGDTMAWLSACLHIAIWHSVRWLLRCIVYGGLAQLMPLSMDALACELPPAADVHSFQ